MSNNNENNNRRLNIGQAPQDAQSSLEDLQKQLQAARGNTEPAANIPEEQPATPAEVVNQPEPEGVAEPEPVVPESEVSQEIPADIDTPSDAPAKFFNPMTGQYEIDLSAEAAKVIDKARNSDVPLATQIGRGVAQGAADIVNDVGDTVELAGNLPFIPKFDIPDLELFTDDELGAAGKLTSGLVNYAGVFVPIAGAVGKVGQVAKVAGAAKGVGALGKAVGAAGGLASKGIGQGIAAGIPTDFIVFDENDGNLAAMLNNTGFGDTLVPDFLAIGEDDSTFEAKMKQVVEGAVLGGALGAVGKAISSSVRQGKMFSKAYSAAKANGDDAVKALGKASKTVTDMDAFKTTGRLAVDIDTKKIVDPLEISQTRAKEFAAARPKVVAEIDSVLKKGTSSPVDQVEDLLKVAERNGLSSEDLVKAIDASPSLQRNLTKEVAGEAGTIDQAALVKKVAGDMGLDANTVANAAENFAVGLKEAPQVVMELRIKAGVLARNLNKMAKKISEKPVRTKEDIADFLAAKSAYENVIAPYRKATSSIGSALNATRRQVGKDRILADNELLIRLKEANGNEKVINDMMHLLSRVDDESMTMRFMNSIFDKTKLSTELVSDVWRRMLLTSLSTNSWNLASTGINMYHRSLVRAIGASGAGTIGKISRNLPFAADPKEAARLAAREWGAISGYHSQLGHGIKAGWKVFKNPNAQPALTSTAMFRDTTKDIFDPTLWGANPDGLAARALKFVGTATSLGSYRPLGAGDSMFKVMTGRETVKQHIKAIAATEKGLKGKEVYDFIDRNMKNIFDQSGNFREFDDIAKIIEREASDAGLEGAARKAFIREQLEKSLSEDTFEYLKKYGKDRALEAAFQTPLESQFGKSFLEGLEEVPMARFLFPFVTTPVNIGKQFLKQVPALGPVVSRQQRRALLAGTTEEKAVALGEQFIGTAVVTTAATLFANGRITGRGPIDPDENKAWRNAGFEPYSFMFYDEEGNPTSSLQFGNLDHPAMIPMVLVSDILNADIYMRSSGEDSLMDAFNAVRYAVSGLASDRFYIRHISEMMDAATDGDDRKINRIFNNYISGFVPRIAREIEPDSDKVIRDVRTWIDALYKNIPGARENIAPRYNPLGEPAKQKDYWDASDMLPFKYAKSNPDPIAQEMLDIAYFPTALQKTYKVSSLARKSIDLTQLKNDKGVSAYDRWNQLMSTTKINGLTLRQSLMKLIKSKQYKRGTDGGEGPGVDRDIITLKQQDMAAEISAYKSEAKFLLMDEFPEIDQEVERVERKSMLMDDQGYTEEEADKLLKGKYGLEKLNDKLRNN